MKLSGLKFKLTRHLVTKFGALQVLYVKLMKDLSFTNESIACNTGKLIIFYTFKQKFELFTS